MVLLLALDIGNGLWELRNANTEGAVFDLPLEQLVFGEGIVYPFGGTTLTSCSAEAIDRVEGIDNRIWMWSGIPPIAIAFILCLRAIPPRNGQSRALNDRGMRAFRSLVLKTQ